MKKNLRTCVALAMALLLAATALTPALAAELTQFSEWGDMLDTPGAVKVDEDTLRSYGITVHVNVNTSKDLNGFVTKKETFEHAPEWDWHIIGTSVIWKSSNPAIISVSDKGIATAHKNGTAKVTFSGLDNYGVRRVATLLVSGVPKAAAPTQSQISITDGSWVDAAQLLAYGEYESIAWRSGDDKIARVDQAGLVLARSVGSVTIYATVTDANGAETTRTLRLRVSTSLLERRQDAVLLLRKGQVVDMRQLYYSNYRSGLEDVGCASGDASILAVDGMKLTAKEVGTVKAGVYTEEDGIRTTRYSLAVTVVE